MQINDLAKKSHKDGLKLDRAKEPRGVTRWLSDVEKGRLLEACKESSWDRLHLLVNMALTTGARRSEPVNLKWDDIDFDSDSHTPSPTAYCSDTKNGTVGGWLQCDHISSIN